MNDLFESPLISDDESIYTTKPQPGDVGIIRGYLREDGQSMARLGVYSGVEETTQRHVIITTNRGFGHRRLQGIEQNAAFAMKVVKTLTPDSLHRLRQEIYFGEGADRNDDLG